MVKLDVTQSYIAFNIYKNHFHVTIGIMNLKCHLIEYLVMASDEQLYRAYTFNVAGFALMTPFGKLILDVLSIYKEFELNIFSIGYIIFCFGLVIVGFRSVAHGRDILDI